MLSLTPARGSKTQNRPIKENTTPEKQTPCTGSSTPLHTKEAQVAETLVAMATTPVKQVPVERLQPLPAASAQASSEGQTYSGGGGGVSLDGAADDPAPVGGRQVLRTPKKRKARQLVLVSPDRSGLLNKLIQVSAGALVNGFGEFVDGGNDDPGSAQKRPSSSSKASKQVSRDISLLWISKEIKLHSPMVLSWSNGCHFLRYIC